MPLPDAPTLESVAALAGVSRATASRVLTGSSRVSEAARAAVTVAAKELGYVPNLAARSLVTRRTDSIAFVVSEPEERFFADPFFSTVLRGVHARASAQHFQLVFIVLSNDADREQFERFAAGRHVDGAIVLSLHGPDPLPDRLRRLGIPVVTSGRPFLRRDDVLFVDADNIEGARQATRLLVERGSRAIATITGPLDMVAAVDRLEGFRAELRALGRRPAPHATATSDFTLDGGDIAMQTLLTRSPRIDAVFAANDLMAAGALRALAAAGRSVPDDVAVVGYDDVAIATAVRPALTTIRQPLVRMGEEMAQLLIDSIAGRDDLAPIVVPTEVVRRQSA